MMNMKKHYPWDFNDAEISQKTNDIFKQISFQREDIIWFYRLAIFHQSRAAQLQLEVQKRNAKIRELSEELTQLKRSKGT